MLSFSKIQPLPPKAEGALLVVTVLYLPALSPLVSLALLVQSYSSWTEELVLEGI